MTVSQENHSQSIHLQTTNSQPTIGIIAGEISGDTLGASLIKALKNHYPNARFVGIAGPKMIAEGAESWVDMEEISVMGIAEVVKHLPRLLKIRKTVTERLLAEKPDIFIGIDAPDFNLDVETKLKENGIKTVHYVSPSVWAWRQKRIHKIAKATNLVLALLPFEKSFYDKFNVPCKFVGHSMADSIALKPNREEACEILGLDLQNRYLAILVGSRRTEVDFLSEPFLKAAEILKQRYPDIKILVPLVNSQRHQQFEEIKEKVAPELEVIYCDGHARQALTLADGTLLASGTAALEAMLCKSPMVVGYKMKTSTYILAKKLVKTPYISLPNLLANEMLVPELVQKECTPEKLADALDDYFNPAEQARLTRNALIQRFTDIHRNIQCDADKQAALAIIELMEGQNNDNI